MFGTVIFSFLCGLKIKSFAIDSFNECLLALSQSVSNFISLLMTQDISEKHWLPNNKFIDTYCFLLLRKKWNQLFFLFFIPQWFNFPSRISLYTVSKAFWKLIKTPHTTSSLSTDILMVSIKLISAC